MLRWQRRKGSHADAEELRVGECLATVTATSWDGDAAGSEAWHWVVGGPETPDGEDWAKTQAEARRRAIDNLMTVIDWEGGTTAHVRAELLRLRAEG